MLCANVLTPSALPDLYPKLPPQPVFRLQKSNDISTYLNSQVAHYRVVAKKYKRQNYMLTRALLFLAFFRRRLQARALARLFL